MLPVSSAPSAQAQAVQCASGRESLRPHRRILRALDRDGQPDSCPTSLGLMSERLNGAARGHGCSGEVPFPQEQHRGPPFPGRADRAPGRAPPRVRTFTLRRPRGRALGGGGRLPGLRAGEAWPPGLGRRAAELGGRPPVLQARARSPKLAVPGPPPASSRPGRPRLLRASRPPHAGPRGPAGAPPPDPGNTNRRRLARPRSL